MQPAATLSDVINVFEDFIMKTDEQLQKIVVVLSKSKEWVTKMSTKASDQTDMYLFSDVEAFKTFVQCHGAREIVIDLDIKENNAIEMAVELGLESFFNVKLVFTSCEEPTAIELENIKKISAIFERKKDILDKSYKQKGAH